MAELPLDATQLAISQLQKVAAQSPIAKQGVEVLVRLLNQQQVQLSAANTRQSITQENNRGAINIILNTQGVHPQLKDNVRYIASVNTDNGLPLLTLRAISAQTQANNAIILTPTQTRQLLSLPASALFPPVSSSGKPVNLPQVQATVLRANATQVTLNVPINGQSEHVSLPLALNQGSPQNLHAGDRVTVQLTPVGGQYLVKLIRSEESGTRPVHSLQHEHANHRLASKTSAFGQVQVQQQAQQQVMSPSKILPILEKSLRALPNNSLQLQAPALLQQLTQLPETLKAQLSPNKHAYTLKPLPTVVHLTTLAGGQSKITGLGEQGQKQGQGQMPGKAIQIKLSSQDIPTLVQFIRSNSESRQSRTLESGQASPVVYTSQTLAKAKLSHAKAGQPDRHFQQGKITDEAIPTAGEDSLTHARATNKNKVGVTQAKPIFTPQQLTHLRNMINAREENPVSTSQILKNLLESVSNGDAKQTPLLKTLTDFIQPQISRLTLTGSEGDADSIRNQINLPPNALSANLLLNSVMQPTTTSTQSSSNVVNGLVALVQLSLTSRLHRNHSQSSERLQGVIRQLFPNLATTTNRTGFSRSMQDLSQIESKHQLLDSIGKLLSNHQTNKLVSAEQSAQGQEALYYTFASTSSKQTDNEVLIKREPESQQQKNPNLAKRSNWQLTMKLNIGEQGELLSKVKLRDNEVDLSIYASNDSLKNKVMDFLPLLKTRLTSLGLQINQASCQLGKIPDSLKSRPYQILQTQA